MNTFLEAYRATTVSLAAKKENPYPTPSPILRASESFSTSLLQTLGVILLFVFLLQPLAPWLVRTTTQNHTCETIFPLPTSHLKKTTYDYDVVPGPSLYCNGDPINGLDPDGRCVEGTKAGWANGNGSLAGTYDSSQASSPFAYGLGWTVGGALGTINGMAASLTTRPLAAMGRGFNEVTDFAEENLNLPPGSLTAATFIFAPLAVAGESGVIPEGGQTIKNVSIAQAPLLTEGATVPNASGVIRSFVQETDEIYYRVYSENQQGSFLTAVKPKNLASAQETLALPPENRATYIQEVLVPKGTRLQRSRARASFGRRGGAEEFQLLDIIPNSNFSNGVLFQ